MMPSAFLFCFFGGDGFVLVPSLSLSSTPLSSYLSSVDSLSLLSQ